jgi:hypothetical protein
MIPKDLNKYFWDVSPDTIDRTANKGYVISRLLELGDETAVKWLEESYAADDLCDAVKTSRSLSPKSRNYWTLKYHLSSHA